jgi:hypothetical protein
MGSGSCTISNKKPQRTAHQHRALVLVGRKLVISKEEVEPTSNCGARKPTDTPVDSNLAARTWRRALPESAAAGVMRDLYARARWARAGSRRAEDEAEDEHWEARAPTTTLVATSDMARQISCGRLLLGFGLHSDPNTSRRLLLERGRQFFGSQPRARMESV